MNMKKSFPYYLSFTAILTLLLLVAVPVMARVLIDSSGEVVIIQGQVLSSGSGESDSESSGSGSGESDNDSSGSGSSGSSGTSSPTPTPTKTETRSEDGTRTRTEIRDDGEVRTEVRLPDGTRVKTRAEDDRTRTDVYQGGVKIRLEREGDRFRIKAENELGEETNLGEDELISIDERADRNQIRIRTFDAAADQLRNRAIIERRNTQALTDLPLSIDLATNELTVTTPAGEKTVTVLPDQAVQNMLAANVIDRIGGQELVNLVRQGGVETLGQVIRLSEQNGVPIYEIAGVKEHRLLGFFPVTTDVTVTVSAETGEVVDTQQSFLDTVVDIFSTAV
jgi:hypothetical protein